MRATPPSFRLSPEGDTEEGVGGSMDDDVSWEFPEKSLETKECVCGVAVEDDGMRKQRHTNPGTTNPVGWSVLWCEGPQRPHVADARHHSAVRRWTVSL